MTTAEPKIAAAPISWGVCEAPNWGVQLNPERVLSEMAELGFSATEFGPIGFLPEEPTEKIHLLAQYGLTATGGFIPVVLHEADHDPIPGVAAEIASYEACGAKVLVLAAATGADGYDSRPALADDGWSRLLNRLDRVLVGSTIPLCLDTGHLLIGGIDPIAFAAGHADRIAHVHLKDVNLHLAKAVQAGERGYYDAVRAGMYRPLGQGDIDISSILASLSRSRFDGWFVLEQDQVLINEPAPDSGPINQARSSLQFLHSALADTSQQHRPARQGADN